MQCKDIRTIDRSFNADWRSLRTTRVIRSPGPYGDAEPRPSAGKPSLRKVDVVLCVIDDLLPIYNKN
jgi:hypothetical protein